MIALLVLAAVLAIVGINIYLIGRIEGRQGDFPEGGWFFACFPVFAPFFLAFVLVVIAGTWCFELGKRHGAED